MANLPETPQWEEGIYQIEVSDPVLGGPDGISNRQGKQLASRTLYLKQQVEKGGTDLAKHIAAADPHTQYAPKASPIFTGTPTAPTPANSDNSKKLATTEFVAKALAALAGSAPETLDTLKELADALGNDPNFATTVLNKLAEKLAKDQNGADIPDPALFVKNLGLGEAAKRNVGTGDNQIPDMGAFASGSGWFRLPGGYIVQFGTFSGNTTRFISGHFPIPFPNRPMVSVSVMSDAVQSDPSNPAPQVLSVNFEHISNSAWRVATSDISQQYRFSYISIGW